MVGWEDGRSWLRDGRRRPELPCGMSREMQGCDGRGEDLVRDRMGVLGESGRGRGEHPRP